MAGKCADRDLEQQRVEFDGKTKEGQAQITFLAAFGVPLEYRGRDGVWVESKLPNKGASIAGKPYRVRQGETD